jgi:hypothetical protein
LAVAATAAAAAAAARRKQGKNDFRFHPTSSRQFLEAIMADRSLLGGVWEMILITAYWMCSK